MLLNEYKWTRCTKKNDNESNNSSYETNYVPKIEIYYYLTEYMVDFLLGLVSECTKKEC